MRGEFTNILQDVVKDCLDPNENAENFTCDFIYNESGWSNPWAGIRCTTVTEKYRNGVYIKYQWENEDELSLGIYFGENEVSEETRTKMYHYFIQKINTPDDFSNDTNSKEKYLFRKIYDFDNLDENELINDLTSILKCYEEIISTLEDFYKENKIIFKIIDGKIHALTINTIKNSTNESRYNQYKQYLNPLVEEYLFKDIGFTNLDKDVLGLENTKGWRSMSVLTYIGLHDSFKGIFKNQSHEDAINELKSTENSDYAELIRILENFGKEGNNKIEFTKPHISTSEGKFSINGEFIEEGGGGQSHYILPKDFYYYVVREKHDVLITDSDLNYARKEEDGDAYVLNPNYTFNLGPGILWLIGKEYAKRQNKFIAGSSFSNDKFILYRTVYNQMGSNEFTDSKKEEYEWFVKLYDKNLIGNRLILSIDEENKILTFDIGFNAIKATVTKEDVEPESDELFDKYPKNRIFYGAPGTGKSYKLNEEKDDLLSGLTNNYERVTFHPDYTYAHFVGTYKPVMKKIKKDNEQIEVDQDEEQIEYKFVQGPFMRVLINAIENPDRPYILIIEEINRANVAAVFGEVFQLLDRTEDGRSEYPIHASEDIKSFLENKFDEEYNSYFPNNEIRIPSNMFIWATMNSADQGVFPIDTAFKRRWDFTYISIDNNEEKRNDIFLKVAGKSYKWNDVRKKINDYLLGQHINEDKLMGPFFINKEKSKSIEDLFKDKVLMYLFEDAGKSIQPDLFSNYDDTIGPLSFSNILNDFDKRGMDIFNSEISEEIEYDDIKPEIEDKSISNSEKIEEIEYDDTELETDEE